MISQFVVLVERYIMTTAVKARYLTTWIAILLCVGMASNNLQAGQKVRHFNPYVVSVEVQDKTHPSREKAISQALGDVFVKVTGLPDVGEQPKSPC